MASANPKAEQDILNLISSIEQMKTNVNATNDEIVKNSFIQAMDGLKNSLGEKIVKNKSSCNSDWSPGQAFSVISEAKDEDKKKREKLIDIYKKVKEIFEKFDDSLLKNLNTYFGCNVKDKVTEKITELDIKEYAVLFAGEVSSGKSSLINLILGEKILPVGLQAVTPTICEIRYHETRKIRLHYVDKQKETKEVILKEPDEGHNYADQLTNYLDQKEDRDKGSPYEKCELFWPHDLLKGVVIVDSPGVGECDGMTSRVTEYLSKAFSFVYVLNSANGGGVHTDRIVTILKNLKQKYPEYFVNECALFVCNKWDEVEKAEDAKGFKCSIVKKLEEHWPNLQPPDQVIEFSTKTAAWAQNAEYKYVTEQFRKLMSLFRSMMLRTISSKLEDEYRWLKDVLDRIVYYFKAFIRHSKDNASKTDDLMMLHSRLKHMEEQNNNSLHQIEKEMEGKIDGVFKEFHEHFKSTNIKSRLKTWTKDECPRVEESWEKTKTLINKMIRNRINSEINKYEKEAKVVETAQASLIQRLLQYQNDIKTRVKLFDAEILGESIKLKPVTTLLVTNMFWLAVTSPVWVPVGLAASVIGLPAYGFWKLYKYRKSPEEERSYNKNRSEYMAKKYEDFAKFNLKEILDEFVTEQFGEIKENLEKISVKSRKVIAANESLVNELCQKRISVVKDLRLYEEQEANCSDIIGELAMFAVKEVFASDIAIESLRLEEKSLLGKGAFADVFEVKMENQNDQGADVAVKIFHDLLNKKNAPQLISEEKQLRMLHHPNIVKFLGRTLQHNDSGTRVILVMELRKDNLRSFLEKHNPEFIPAEKPKNLPQVTRDMVKRATDVASGLEYLHGCNIVHRDLKPENILVGSDNMLKIADVGISKRLIDITGTICGTPIYMAPEVFDSEPYNALVDIYSFGLIVWEMWYGRRVFSDLLQTSLEEFCKKIKSGHRPEIRIDGCFPPPADLESLISKCWSTDPKDRLSAHKCVLNLTSTLKAKKK